MENGLPTDAGLTLPRGANIGANIRWTRTPRYGSPTLSGLHWLELLIVSVVKPLRKWPM